LLIGIRVDAPLILLALHVPGLAKLSEYYQCSEHLEHVDNAALLHLVFDLEVTPELLRVVFFTVFGALCFCFDLLLELGKHLRLLL